MVIKNTNTWREKDGDDERNGALILTILKKSLEEQEQLMS